MALGAWRLALNLAAVARCGVRVASAAGLGKLRSARVNAALGPPRPRQLARLGLLGAQWGMENGKCATRARAPR